MCADSFIQTIIYNDDTDTVVIHSKCLLCTRVCHFYEISYIISQYTFLCHNMSCVMIRNYYVGLIELWFTCSLSTYIYWDEGLDFCASVDYVTHQSISITMVSISLALPALFTLLTFWLLLAELTVKRVWSHPYTELVRAATIVAAPIRIQHFT